MVIKLKKFSLQMTSGVNEINNNDNHRIRYKMLLKITYQLNVK